MADADPDDGEPAWDIARLFPNQGHWSRHQYFALVTNRQVELSDGRIEVLPLPTRLHAAIAVLMCDLLPAFVATEPDALVLTTQFAVRLWPGKPRQPDVVYIGGRNVARQHEAHWDGADLAVEIVSEEGRQRDRVTERREYARAGVTAYRIVDPLLRRVTVLQLVDRAYIEARVYGLGDVAVPVLLPVFAVALIDVFNAR